MSWEKDLSKKILLAEALDVKNAGGVYDFAIEIAIEIEDIIGQSFDNKIDDVVKCIYNKIKYGERNE